MNGDEWSRYAAEKRAGVYDDIPTQEELEDARADDDRDRQLDWLIEDGLWP